MRGINGLLGGCGSRDMLVGLGTKEAAIPAIVTSTFVVASILLAVGAAGCGGHRVQARRLPAWVFESARMERSPQQNPRPRGGVRGRSDASDFVVAALQGEGLRFGTDGSVPALWGYLHDSHTILPVTAARPGDVLFFQTQVSLPPTAPGLASCQLPDHVGIVSRVDDDGRISFVEARDGHVRQSYADPRRPQLRRDGMGRVVNTFLRPKRADDPTDTPNFAGEMACAAARPRG
ncbi:MAG: CHAP domain-containing protein [Myxococcales bacterium]